MAKWTGLGIVAGVAVLAALVYLRRTPADGAGGTDFDVAVAQLLAASADADFAAVRYPREFEFPADHLQHSDFRTEWWSVSGALQTRSGTALGLQLLLARIGLSPGAPMRESRWAATEIYAGFASLSDPLDEQLVTGQRLSRGALGLAGAALDPVRFWIEDWRFEALDGATPAVDLQARLAIDALELDLRLENVLPLIDTNALSAETAAQGAPFQFYLQPRLQATGTLRSGEDSVEVLGDMTFEHAWGELPLPGGPIARDRITIYLDDQRVIMIVVTHRADGTGTPEAGGMLIGADGRADVLGAADLQLDVVETWTSPRTAGHYPVRWTLRIPRHAIELTLTAEHEDQEGDEWTAFWAGPIQARDARDSALGRGFAQLYGYDAR